MSVGARHRSLNLAQTLDELLGTKDSDRNSLNSPARPPTRHGRESAGSSNEENKDPSPKTPSTGVQTMRFHEGPASRQQSNEENEQDDFMAKLNALRRRSLVSSGDVGDRKINGEEKRPSVTLRQPSKIHEESEDEKPESQVSRRPSTSSSQKTFRINADTLAPTVSSSSVSLRKEPIEKTMLKITGKPPAIKPASAGSFRARMLMDDSGHSKWLMKKEEELRQKKREEAEKEEKKKKELEEKKRNGQLTFERWRQNYDERVKEKRRDEKLKERAKSANKTEAEKQKKQDAEKTFEAWKKERSRSLSSRKKKEETEEERRKRKKEEEEKTKRAEAEKAFMAWKGAKEAKEEEERRQLEERRRAALERKRLDDEYKEMVAQQAFETWMELKEVQYQQEQLMQDMPIETRNVPWVPPSNTIPRQFTPSRNRRRSLERRHPRVQSSSSLNRRAQSAKSVKF